LESDFGQALPHWMTGRTIPEEAPHEQLCHTPALSSPVALPDLEGHAWLVARPWFALAVYYFIVSIQGARRVFASKYPEL